MSTQVKRLYQNDTEFVPITLAEAVVVNTSSIPGLTSLGITTLEKVLRNTLGIVASNAVDIDNLETAVTNINAALSSKQDKLTPGAGITISSTGVISCSTTGFSYKIITSLPSPAAEYENTVYLLPNDDGVDGNLFSEYICVKNSTGNYFWEQIGTVQTDINLDGYITRAEFEDFKLTSLTAEDVTTSAGVSVSVSYNIPTTLYD